MSLLANIRIKLSARQRLADVRAEVVHWSRRPRRVLFNHIPKSGGATVNAFLKENFPTRYTFKTEPDYLASAQEFATWSESRRFGFRLIAGHFTDLLVDKVHPDTLITTVLREPVDGIVSLYYYKLQQATLRDDPSVSAELLSLADFAAGALGMKDVNPITQRIAGISASEIAQTPEAAVDRAYEVVETDYHVVGFQDRLAEFGDQVMRKARLSFPLGARRDNQTRNRVALADIPESVRRKIVEINAPDIELYRRLRKRWAPPR